MVLEEFRFYVYKGQMTWYMVSDKGNVIHKTFYKNNKDFMKALKDIKPYKTGNKYRKYFKVKLATLGNKQISVARMVAETFIPNPENKPHVDHINGNTFDNRVENLRWCTNKENHNFPLARYNHKKARIKVLEQKYKQLKLNI